MKPLLHTLIFVIAACAQGATSDVRIQQQSSAGSWPDKIVSPTANSLLGFDGSKGVSGVTAGTGLTLSSGVLTNAGVTGITGTTNQITVSAATGSVALSLPTAIAGVNSLTAATNTALTLATLDNNKDVAISPHGSGRTAVTSGGTGVLSWQKSGGGVGYLYSDTNTIGWGSTANFGGGVGGVVYNTSTLVLSLYTGGDIGLTFDYPTRNATFAASIKTSAPNTGTAAAWKMGVAVTTTGLALSTTVYLQVDVAGTLYKVATVN